jgi:putative heme-binding domain-containing protein
MPALPLPDNDIWEVVAFLRSLTTPAFFVPVQGDPEAGAEVYRRSKCGSCHMILGHGGFLGPDLTDLASSRTVKQLRQAVLNPGELTIDGFKGVTVVLRDGRRISGVAKNSSDYSMDVLDASGDLHLLETSDVRSTQFANKSLMPDNYSTTLSSAELNNLIAFLSRQAVRPDAKTGQRTAENAEGH